MLNRYDLAAVSIANEMFHADIAMEDFTPSDVEQELTEAREAMLKNIDNEKRPTNKLAKNITAWTITLGRRVNAVKNEEDKTQFIEALHEFVEYFTGTKNDVESSSFSRAIESSDDSRMTEEEYQKWFENLKKLYADMKDYVTAKLKEL